MASETVRDLLTTTEAADLLHVPAPTLRFWRHQGTGPKSFTLGPKKVMYRRADIEAWIAAQYEGTARGGRDSGDAA